MKRTIILMMTLLLTLAMAVSFSGCAGDEEGSGSQEETKVSDAGALGDYDVAIGDYSIVKDYEGSDAIAVTYEFTNNGEDAIAFDVACMYTVFQDGVELEYTTVYEDEDSFTMLDEATMSEIQPGTTIEVTTTSRLANLTSPVTVEVEEFMGMSGDKLTKTFDIAQ